MNIKIERSYKSITAPCEFELPDFTVLTGKNGSGKTHLLEVISNNSLSTILINGQKCHNIRYIGFNGLNPQIDENCDPSTINQFVKQVWQQYHTTIQHLQNLTDGQILQADLNSYGFYYTNYLKSVISNSQKSVRNLTEDDFSNSFDVSFMGNRDYFTSQIAMIFKSYHKKQLENQMNMYYRDKSMPMTGDVLSEADFIQKYGITPWDFINNIFSDVGLPYEANNPIGTKLESSFIFKLKDRTNSFEISSFDLSTGERILMSLALAIYNSKGNANKPDLLFLDEPDAGLHPSMSKKMIQVIQKNIVAESQIPVIITTHSPTTVIAADGSAIYQLNRGNNIPVKISTQEAIEILSSDIPFLKISTEKRRVVFVESPYDVEYYEQMTNIFAKTYIFQSQPVFVPARTSNGSNCEDVISVVSNLVNNGHTQVYGIVDWDKHRVSTERILVLGVGERYAIENYLLDPLLMGMLFIRENKKDFNYFDITEVSAYSQLGSLTEAQAQKIIDKVLDDLGLYSQNMVDYQTINGWYLKMSTEFNHHQGHGIEELYKNKYLFLQSYRREDALKKDIIAKVINDYPKYAPFQLLETMKKIV